MKHVILIAVVLSFLANCSSKKESESIIRPATNANTDLRRMEIDTVKVGDKLIKARAVLGKPTLEKTTNAGSELTWYFIPSTYSDEAFQTLKEVPKAIKELNKLKEDSKKEEGKKEEDKKETLNSDIQFLKIISDPKGVITAKEINL